MFASWALSNVSVGVYNAFHLWASCLGYAHLWCNPRHAKCCEVKGAATFAAKGREQSVKGCLQILHEITTVGPSTPTAILLAKLGLHAVFDEWFLGAAKFGTIL